MKIINPSESVSRVIWIYHDLFGAIKNIASSMKKKTKIELLKVLDSCFQFSIIIKYFDFFGNFNNA